MGDASISERQSATSQLDEERREEEQGDEDDALLSEESTEPKSATPEDLHSDTISRSQALSLAVVFEELGDKLAIVSNSFSTPSVEMRTKTSIQISEEEHRAVLHELTVSDNEEEEEEEWLVKQHHGTFIPHRLSYIINPRSEQPPTVADVLKRSGVKGNTESERNQRILVELHLLANALVTELVLDCSFDSVTQKVQEEKLEKQMMLQQFMKVNDTKEYIQEVKASIKKARSDKVAMKDVHLADVHNLNDLLLEQNMRSKMEDKYVRKHGVAIVASGRRNNASREEKKIREFQNMKEMLKLEVTIHEGMMKVIERKLQETQTTLETVVEKYEKDFSRLNSDLEKLCKDRRRDLERIKWLERRIVDYERIVFDNRRIKQKEMDKERKKINENKKAVKIQAWWRGLMVTKRLGPFKQLFGELFDFKAQKAALRAAQKAGLRPARKSKPQK